MITVRTVMPANAFKLHTAPLEAPSPQGTASVGFQGQILVTHTDALCSHYCKLCEKF